MNKNINQFELISILIPCRNEEKFIKNVITDLLNQDYPKHQLEILFIDGMSNDNTREIITEYVQQYPFIKLLDNPCKTVPYAMNLAIKEASGTYIMRMDAHASYPSNYVSQLFYWLNYWFFQSSFFII